jgi:acetyl esterase/lipase
MKKILGEAKTIRQLLANSKYSIDYYQREYKWGTEQVTELVGDLTNKFLDDYEAGDPRSAVESYGHYFLGSIILSSKEATRFIVDGQQRLTALTLLLTYLNNLQRQRPEAERVAVEELVFSTRFGRKSFNIDVDERAEWEHRCPGGSCVVAPCSADRGGQRKKIVRDQYGNAKGGVRSPYIDMPAYRYVASVTPDMVSSKTGGAARFMVGMLGLQIELPAETVNKLYTTRANYLKMFNAQIDKMVADRFLLPPDAEKLKAEEAKNPPAQLDPPPQDLPADVEIYRDLSYLPGGHERHKLDVYVPKNAKGQLPLVVWVHGGGWSMGSKNNPPALFLLRHGYAVASINYRLVQHAPFPAQIEDCKAALRWLRAHADKYHIDPKHVGVWGASAGGHLVALWGTTNGKKELEGKEGHLDQSSSVQAVVDYFGPTDLKRYLKLLGIEQNKEKAALASPLTHVNKDCPPFLIVHGDKDLAVPYRESEELTAALKKAGVDVTLHKLEGVGHGGGEMAGYKTDGLPARSRAREFLNEESQKRILDFFDRTLKSR